MVLCFGHLPFADGTLPLPFVFKNVTFHRVWGEIAKNEGSLWCLGSEESPSGVWHDATVLLGFGALPCTVCKVVAEIDGHGPEATLTGYLLDGSTQTAVCPGDKQTLILTTTQDNPFVSVAISGEEAEYCCMHLE